MGTNQEEEEEELSVNEGYEEGTLESQMDMMKMDLRIVRKKKKESQQAFRGMTGLMQKMQTQLSTLSV